MLIPYGLDSAPLSRILIKDLGEVDEGVVLDSIRKEGHERMIQTTNALVEGESGVVVLFLACLGNRSW